MNGAHKELLKALSECRSELRAIESQTSDAYAEAYGPCKIDWGHVGDANRLLADLKDIRRYWVADTMAA